MEFSINDRLLHFLDKNGISGYKLSNEIGVSEAVISNVRKHKNKPNTDLIQSILNKYEVLNPEWLLTGKGAMIKEEGANNTNTQHVIGNSNQAQQGNHNHIGTAQNATKTTILQNLNSGKKNVSEFSEIPLIPLDAIAGIGVGGEGYQIRDEDIEDTYIVPDFDRVKPDYLIRTKGSSMSPKYNSGDILACKKIPLSDYIQWNKPHVLDTQTQGVLVKRIKKSDTPKSWKLISDNKKYDPFDIPIKTIRHIAIVVGVIRLE